MAIAILDSVTVSMADEKKGTFKLILFVSLRVIFVSAGRTLEYLGNIKMSSKVKASLIVPISTYIQLL